jgi:hypothetical protein
MSINRETKFVHNRKMFSRKHTHTQAHLKKGGFGLLLGSAQPASNKSDEEETKIQDEEEEDGFTY